MKIDYTLLGVTLGIIIFGIVILSSASASFSQANFDNPYYFLKHQLLFGLIPGLILAYLVFRLRLDYIKKSAPLFLLASLIFLSLVFVPKIGTSLGGATRWISLGTLSFQPSELLKLAFILYLASWLATRTGKVNSKKQIDFSQTLIAFSAVIGIISLLLIFQPDVSTLGIITSTAFLMYFLANTPLWHSVLIILVGMTGLLALTILAPYRFDRLKVFLNPELEPFGIGYQIKQALISVGSGGILGQGLGMSQQRFGSLPQYVSDSIFAILAEETGFVWSVILVFLFSLFLWRGFKIAKVQKDKFSKLTAFGITFWIVFQAFINISSIIGILPMTGIPLPFISYGGSALISELIGVGVLLNISKR